MNEWGIPEKHWEVQFGQSMGYKKKGSSEIQLEAALSPYHRKTLLPCATGRREQFNNISQTMTPVNAGADNFGYAYQYWGSQGQ